MIILPSEMNFLVSTSGSSGSATTSCEPFANLPNSGKKLQKVLTVQEKTWLTLEIYRNSQILSL
jgi:hypothetical protein